MSRVSTLAPRLPLSFSPNGGYNMLVTIKQATKQNFKCLLLTAPGERMMDPQFGVGLKKYLFENYTPQLRTKISFDIQQQVSTYMPFLTLRNIRIESGEDFSPPDFNRVYISVEYAINSVSVVDILNINVTNNQ
tara:strand:- start:3825 stop:4226 length:402 start_codon:yes stop_codon:yes gene_type:complete